MTTMPKNTGTLTIGSLDDPGLTVSAQFNPKELQVERTIPWNPHGKPNTSDIQLEFAGAQGRTVSVELFFDAVEMQNGSPATLAASIASLEKMASVRKPGSPKDDELRPHHVAVVWGNVVSFQCVIEQLTTKYTMFDGGGNPLRATVTVKLKEATRLSMSANAKPASASRSGGAGGGSGGAA